MNTGVIGDYLSQVNLYLISNIQTWIDHFSREMPIKNTTGDVIVLA
jgi:hypothetical protein